VEKRSTGQMKQAYLIFSVFVKESHKKSHTALMPHSSGV
jgi:hypothetical protein